MIEQVDSQIPPPWYRQFWPWYLMALPASAVIAGLATVFIATVNRDNLVMDNYYKEGLAINQTLTQQQQAKTMNLLANVTLHSEQGKLELLLSSSQQIDDPVLKLTIAHSTQAERDQILFLTRQQANLYIGNISNLGSGKWHFILEPATAQWRIEADVTLPKQSWLLTPNV